MKIFLDGEIVSADAWLLESLTPGILQAQGMFETMRVEGGEISFFDLHMQRLQRGLRLVRLQLPIPTAQIKKTILILMRQNKFTNARVRVMVWRKSQKTRIAMVGQPLPSKHRRSMRVIISTVTRPLTRFSHVKSLDYFCFRKAYLEAQMKGADEAILLNHCGELVEGSRTNLFWMKDNVLYTPAIECGCLNGIGRQLVIKNARQKGIPVKFVHASLHALLTADEAFLTNAVMGRVLLAQNGRIVSLQHL